MVLGALRESVMTATFKMDNQQDLLYNTGNAAQCYVAAWMGGESGGEWHVYMYVWVPLLFTWNFHNIADRLCVRSVTQLCPTLATPWTVACQAILQSKNAREGCHFLLQGIFQTQGSNLHRLHWQADSLPLNHRGSSYTLIQNKKLKKKKDSVMSNTFSMNDLCKNIHPTWMPPKLCGFRRMPIAYFWGETLPVTYTWWSLHCSLFSLKELFSKYL